MIRIRRTWPRRRRAPTGVLSAPLLGNWKVSIADFDVGRIVFLLRFSKIALTFSFNLPTVEQDTDTEDMATAMAGTDRRSLGVAVRKLEGKCSSLAYSFSHFDFRTSRSLFRLIYPL